MSEAKDNFVVEAKKTKRIQMGDDWGTILSIPRFKIIVVEGQDKGKRAVLDLPIRLGSSADNDFVLTDSTVSRQHAEIVGLEDGFEVRDLDSTNGTFLKDIKIGTAAVNPGQQIRLGDSLIQFSTTEDKVCVVASKNDRFGRLVGKSPRMRQIFDLIDKIASKPVNIVIEGETGTGKEMVARTIHEHSSRKDGPFIVFDCSNVDKELMRAELFGHEEGAFTGATQRRQGAFEAAHKGTIFLDEIGELDIDLQPKLLRVLEEREIRRLGSPHPTKVDVRVVCATNRDLQQMVSEGTFREDLYYRLYVVKINLPPLRERKEDIPLLATHFIKQKIDEGSPVNKIAPEAMNILKGLNLMGNVRALRNVMERAIALCDGDTITEDCLAMDPFSRAAAGEQGTGSGDGDGGSAEGSAPRPSGTVGGATMTLEEIEREAIREALESTGGNKSAAARKLGIGLTTLHRKVKRYDL